MKKYTTLDFCEDVLKEVGRPLGYYAIWEHGLESKSNFLQKWDTKGETPWDTIAARLYVDIRDNKQSKFFIAHKKPTLFFLKSEANSTYNLNTNIQKEETKTKKENFAEKDLHSLLTYFAYSNFNKGKAIITKTIFHEKSKKTGYNEWVHPDMVGFYLPIEEWNKEVMQFNKTTGHNPITLYSFELKKKLDASNYRACFFQAVSNSSWSNEGYLVTTKIQDDEELLNELERLSQSFGIGIIKLDINNIDSSKILYSARKKENLDWGMINKLAEQNPDFSTFIDDVKFDITSERISKDRYAEVLRDIESYIDKITSKTN